MRFRRKIISTLLALASAAGLAATTHASRAGAAPAAPYPAPAYGNAYYMVDAAGQVWPLGGAPDHGSLRGTMLAQPVVGVTVTPDSGGYWLVASDGGVFSFGEASYHGSTGGIRLARPVVGMTPTPDGDGYWLFAGDGGIFAYGDAGFFGSTGGLHLDKPIIGMTATPDGHGYWLYAADGGIFSFGDARFLGSTGNVPLAAPVAGMAATPDGRGYWLVASDGGVFSYGDAGFYGSMSGSGRTVQKVVAAANGDGYWEVDHQGDVFPFGSAASARIPTIAFVHTIVGPGDRAMEWAMAQIGRPYLWGGTGPTAFDCSGLVMRAWEAAGVPGIPRVAADQYDYGAHVAIADLRIGDLVYWATDPADPSTIEHVALYIGGEHMVEAPYTGQVVHTDWINGPGFVNLGSRP